MKRMRWIVVVAALQVSLYAASANAACKFGSSGETPLQGVFDSVVGTRALSATNDCVAESADAVWRGGGETTANIIIELAGFAAENVFGIYDPSNPTTNQVTLFSGSSGAGSGALLSFVDNGSGFDVQANGVVEGHFASNEFGFFLRTPERNTFFSQSALNGDQSDHLYAYQGNGGLFTGGPLAGESFATSMYLLAFEDKLIPKADSDFQDFVALIGFGTPVPLPAGVWLLGGALALLASLGSGRRRIGGRRASGVGRVTTGNVVVADSKSN